MEVDWCGSELQIFGDLSDAQPVLHPLLIFLDEDGSLTWPYLNHAVAIHIIDTETPPEVALLLWIEVLVILKDRSEFTTAQ
jgi:hypothetical protein